MKYGVAKNGVVTQVVEWDGQAEWSPPEGTVLFQNDDVEVGDLYADGVWTAALTPEPTQEQSQLALVAQARLALQKSDVVILRCTENNVQVPATWATYRADLRTFIADDGAGTMPTQPAYPVGT
jgi:hypothetical protein